MGMVKYSQIPQKRKFAMSLQYLKKEVINQVVFCIQINIKVHFNTLGIEVSHNVILSLLMFMVKHSQSTQSNKFAISLEYLKKEVRWFHFLHPIKHQSFYKLALSFLMKVDRHVQSAQNRKFVIFFTIS